MLLVTTCNADECGLYSYENGVVRLLAGLYDDVRGVVSSAGTVWYAAKQDGVYSLMEWVPNATSSKTIAQFPGHEDLHGLGLCAGRLFVVLTGSNRLYSRSLRSGDEHYETLPGYTNQHYNDICWGPDGEVYVSASPAREDGGGHGFILRDMVPYAVGLVYPHSLRWHDGLWYCADGAVTGPAERFELPAFARGLHVSSNRIYAGASPRGGRASITEFDRQANVRVTELTGPRAEKKSPEIYAITEFRK